MTERSTSRQEDTQFRVLQLLEDSPHMTQREPPEELGVNLGKANCCLRALTDKGLINIYQFSKNESKLSYIYLLTLAGIAERAMVCA